MVGSEDSTHPTDYRLANYTMTVPFTDYRLLFSPRWRELPGAVPVILLLILCVGPAALMVWRYR